MEIRIGDYGIRSDSVCFTLFKCHIVQDNKGGKGREAKPENIGKESYRVIGYYPRFQDACKAWLQQELLDNDDKLTIEQLADFIDELEQKIGEINVEV